MRLWLLAPLAALAHCVLASPEVVPCSSFRSAREPFCDPTRSPEERGQDLVSRLRDAELIGQLSSISEPVARLDVPSRNFWNEGLHGVAKSPGVTFRGTTAYSTVFPQVIGLAASFDAELWGAVASKIGDEAAAFRAQDHAFLTWWSPNINIYRDPRWGRGQETAGEDPYLTSRYAEAFVQGLQGPDPDHPRLAATCKHFDAYSFERAAGVPRTAFNARVAPDDLQDTYLPAFEACVRRGGARSVMCAYTSLNGVPSCANSGLLTSILRDQWNFTGFVVSDCSAIRHIYDVAHLSPTPEGTAAAALRAGTDMACRNKRRGTFYAEHLGAALRRGLVTVADLRRAAGRVLTERIRLGEFDPVPDNAPPLGPHGGSLSVTPLSGGSGLAFRAARRSMVLLTNRDGALPLRIDALRSVCLTGPFGSAKDVHLANYHGRPSHVTSVLAALEQWVGKDRVTFTRGSHVRKPLRGGTEAAARAARAADVTIAAVGIDQSVEREMLDRTSITLPAAQTMMLKRVIDDCQAAGKPVVVVLVNGGPVTLDPAIIRGASAILEAWYGGQEAGSAIVDTLFGDVSPAGRLPVSVFPATFPAKQPFGSMDMRAPPGHTYRYYKGPLQFPFGHGLTYSRFHITAPPAVQVPDAGSSDAVKVPLAIRNVGSRSASYTWLACLAPDAKHPLHPSRAPLRLANFTYSKAAAVVKGASIGAQAQGELPSLLQVDGGGRPVQRALPYRFLVGFGRSPQLAPGEVFDAVLAVVPAQLQFADAGGVKRPLFGTFTLRVGPCLAPVHDDDPGATMSVDFGSG